MTADARSSDPCPTFDQIRAFNRGQLEAPVLESISRHLQSCERCVLLFLSVSEAASAVHASAQADASTPLSRGGSTNAQGTSALDPEATVSLAADGAPPAIGRYTVLRLLGRGGFGKVYLARDAELDRLVAIKAPHAERIKRPGDLDAYRHEARLHAGIDHVHVVPIYDVGAEAGAPFFVVSKFVPGIDLAARLREGVPDVRTAAEWTATLAEALDHVHRQGVIHRDVKPRNIMVDPSGRVYLMDFGLAKHVALHNGMEPIVGTPAYMAPEQARGESLDGRCDVYALGMVLYELLTGQRPFRGHGTSIMQQVLSTEPPLPRSIKRTIPRDLEAICVKALAKDRERRYRTAAEMAEDLRRWLRDEPLRLARRVGPVERAWWWTRRHRAVAGLGGVAVAAMALSGFAWMRNPELGAPTFKVMLQTDPPGAEVHYFPISAATGLPEHARGRKASAGSTVDLTPGFHVVVAVLGDGRFHEVFRYVPAVLSELYDPLGNHNRFQVIDDIVHLPPIQIPAGSPEDGMSLVPTSARFLVGPNLPNMPRHHRRIPSFYLDTKEVSVGEYLKAKPSFRFPAGTPQPPDAFPMTCVAWDQAVAYAESIGKRLPDEIEYEYVATELGRRRKPPKDLVASWTITVSGQPEQDRVEIPGQRSIFGLRSNVAEWMGSWAARFPGEQLIPQDPIKRVARGGDFPIINGRFDAPTANWQPYERVFLDRPIGYPGLGFRCARSSKPRIHADSFQRIVSR